MTDMNQEATILLPDDTLQFNCTKAVSCFNECCRDLNQFLTPYDILRLKNHLDLSSTQFLEKYTSQHTGPETGLPIITLKPRYDDHLRCPFVTLQGCRVYPDRPSSCRTYPLSRIATRSRSNGNISERYMLVQEPHCHGFQQTKTQRIKDWIKAQGLEPYNQMNDRLMEIISLKNRLHPKALNLAAQQLFYLALYDLDNFRGQIFTNDLLNGFITEPESLEAIRSDDVALLKLALKWVKAKLFSQP